MRIEEEKKETKGIMINLGINVIFEKEGKERAYQEFPHTHQEAF